MSFNARVSYTANGSTDTFAITFSFIDSTHVKVFLDGVSTTAFTISGSNVVMNSNPSNGVVVLIKRETPTDARLVDFQDGSVLTTQLWEGIVMLLVKLFLRACFLKVN